MLIQLALLAVQFGAKCIAPLMLGFNQGISVLFTLNMVGVLVVLVMFSKQISGVKLTGDGKAIMSSAQAFGKKEKILEIAKAR